MSSTPASGAAPGGGPPLRLSIHQLLDRHEALLLDAYGVLVHHGGALPGAAQLIRRLNEQGRDYHVLTNDAAHLPGTSARRFARMGLPINEARIITSGTLLKRHFTDHQLTGKPCVVLGTQDSHDYVAAAGGALVAADDPGAEVLVLCDEAGYDFVPTVDAAITTLLRRLRAGAPMHLVLPNPDLIYPASADGVGFAAGAMAAMFEAVLAQRLGPRQAPRFHRLGKPHAPAFAEARRRAASDDLVMLGDQLSIDILGAQRAGMAGALVESGLDRHGPRAEVCPDYLLSGLATDD